MAELVGAHDYQVHTVVKVWEGFPQVVTHQGDGLNDSAGGKQCVELSSGLGRHLTP